MDRIIIIDDLDDSIEVDDESETPFFVEMRDITRSGTFSPTRSDSGSDNTDIQDSFPIEGKGRLDNLLIIADSDQFSVTVAVDDREVVDDSYTDLAAISDELSHVSAYETANEFVVAVSGYPFEESLHSSISPTTEITFSRVRAEGVTEDGSSRDL